MQCWHVIKHYVSRSQSKRTGETEAYLPHSRQVQHLLLDSCYQQDSWYRTMQSQLYCRSQLGKVLAAGRYWYRQNLRKKTIVQEWLGFKTYVRSSDNLHGEMRSNRDVTSIITSYKVQGDTRHLFSTSWLIHYIFLYFNYDGWNLYPGPHFNISERRLWNGRWPKCSPFIGWELPKTSFGYWNTPLVRTIQTFKWL